MSVLGMEMGRSAYLCAGERVAPKARRPFPSHQLLRCEDTLRAPGGHRSRDQDSNGAFKGFIVPRPRSHKPMSTHAF